MQSHDLVPVIHFFLHASHVLHTNQLQAARLLFDKDDEAAYRPLGEHVALTKSRHEWRFSPAWAFPFSFW